MSGTFNSAINSIGTFFNRATNEGGIFQNPAVDLGIAGSVLLPFLAPELLGGLGAGAAAADVGALAAPGEAGLSEAALSGLAASPGAGAFASTTLPELLVTPGTELGATIGPGLAAADLGGVGAGVGEAAAAGAGTGLDAGLAAALGISPALAGGLSPSSIVAGEFGQLPGGGTGGALPIGAVPGFGPGGPPLPQARPAGLTGISPVSPGTGAGGPGPLNQNPPTNTAVVPGDPSNILPGTTGPGGGFSLEGESVPASDVTIDPGTTGSTGSNILGGVGNLFKNNAGLLTLLGLGVGGQLASPALSKALGLNKVPGSENLTSLAQQEASLAQQQQQLGAALESPLVTGVLPPGQQQAVTNALNDAIATIKGRYASLGLSGSTMEADAIANAQNRSVEVAGQLEQQMAQTGAQAVSSATSALGLESQIYDTLLNATIQQDAQLGNAISNFASSVGLGTAIGQARTQLA